MAEVSESRRRTNLRLGLMTVGDLAVIGGVIGWIVGWRFGHGVLTLGLALLVAGMWPNKFRLRRSIAEGYLLASRYMKGEEKLEPVWKAVRQYEKLAAKHPDEMPRLAEILDWLSGTLRKFGRHEEAEPVAREAVQAWREIVITDPSRRKNLSEALNSLTVTLSALKRTDELATLTEEAVVVQRSLIATQEAPLAVHLQNLALNLRNAEQWESALPVAEEAASLYRRLVRNDPDELENAADTAAGLATVLRQLDRPQESLRVTREWVEYERALAARRPDRRPELAEALRVLGSRYANLHQVEDGLTCWRESVELWRQLVSESDEHRAAYATACNLVGRGLGVVGEAEESLTVIRTGLDVRRALAAVDPRQYDELLDDLVHAVDGMRPYGDPAVPEFAAEAVTVARGHADDVLQSTVLHAAEVLREADFTEEADALERSIAAG